MTNDLQPQDAQPLAPPELYADVLAQLHRLSRDMLLAFRLQVGKLMLDRFYGGDIHAYRDNAASKASSFAAFVRACPGELAALGLGPQVLRQCINARVTYDLLPPQVRDDLLFSHVVELARLDDPTARARLAMDTTLQNWTVDQLKDAIGQLTLGNYHDTDSTTAGTQPPPPKAAAQRPAQPGRLVTRLEKAVQDLDSWGAQWSGAATHRLRGSQRQRAHQAMAALKAKVAALEALLG